MACINSAKGRGRGLAKCPAADPKKATFSEPKNAPGRRRHLRWNPLLFLRNMLILAIIFVALASVAMSGETTPRMETRVVVQPGDTLWSIASRCRPDTDPRRVIDAMTHMNRLSSRTLYPGAVLYLPHP